MNSNDDSNPYASPTAESRLDPSIAESEIRFVIRILRWIGWLGGIPFVPLAILLTALFAYSSIVEGKRLPADVVPGLILFDLLACLSIASGWVASGMARHRPSARLPALLLCGVMLLGFPLFTIVGIVCIRKVRRYYGAYCTEHLSRLGD
jgi:hypothetical protein